MMIMLILSDNICMDNCRYDDNVNLVRQRFHGVSMVMLILILSDNICRDKCKYDNLDANIVRQYLHG